MDKRKQDFYRKYQKIYPNTNIRGFGQYNLYKTRKYSNCNPSICWNDLMSKGNEYMNRDTVKEKCDCIYKNICLQIIELLSKHKQDEAFTKLNEINGGTYM